MPLTTAVSFVQPGVHVHPAHILLAVRCGARLALLEQNGYHLSRIGAHSLRASGAMALWLSGHGAEAIMKLGRSLTSYAGPNQQAQECTAGEGPTDEAEWGIIQGRENQRNPVIPWEYLNL